MNVPDQASPRSLAVYRSEPHACSYLAEQIAQSLFIPASTRIQPSEYQYLLGLGFRRSGPIGYRPACPDCHACQSLRVAPDSFTMNRSQRRNWAMNRDLSRHLVSGEFHQEHYDLFKRYLQQRHTGDMLDMSAEDYFHFLFATDIETRCLELRDSVGNLVAVAVTDTMESAWSAVYTFYRPDLSARGLGTYAVLSQLAEAKRCQIEWLYLGYFIQESPRMRYKAGFLPHQVFKDDQWVQCHHK